MAPVALLAVYCGSWVFAAVVAAAALLGLYEWFRLVAPDARGLLVAHAGTMVFLTMAVGSLVSVGAGALLGLLFIVALFAMAVRDKLKAPALVAFGIPYMAGSALALIGLRATPESGMGLTFFLLLVVWAVDVGAYLSGSIIGGPKLAPAISPSKTWAGLIGGAVAAAVCGYFVADLAGARRPAVAIVLGPVLAFVAQAGDFFESYFKRRAGVKESGDLIPGHGGVLDRIDGLVFAAAFAFLFQIALGSFVQWW